MRRNRHARQTAYLNAILTANAALLGVLVWSQLGGGPASAHAAPVQATTSSEVGVPNASVQRLQQINELRALRDDLQRIEAALTSGRLRVSIDNLGELKKLLDEAAKSKAAAPAPAAAATQPPPNASVAPSGAAGGGAAPAPKPAGGNG
jgi:hypothetical protein